MVAKLTRLTHNIAIKLNLVAESCTICSSCSRQPVWKLLETPLYGTHARSVEMALCETENWTFKGLVSFLVEMEGRC